MIILDRKQIEDLIDPAAAALAIETAYKASSRGEVNLPPVGHIVFPDCAADCHIKYGHRTNDPFFVIKVATGFPGNAKLGLPSGNGVSLVMSAHTGAVEAVLHDEMIMTDIRTGLGGAIATRCLARHDSKRVLIVGTGPQALRQIESHRAIIGDHLCFDIWGRSPEKAQAVATAVGGHSSAVAADSLAAAVRQADIIVTVTAATQPLIQKEWVKAGTQITAIGADAPGKQELEPNLVAAADRVIADSTDQCLDHGELSHAFNGNLITRSNVREIGEALQKPGQTRQGSAEITLADLTGIAAQDIAIASVVLDEYRRR